MPATITGDYSKYPSSIRGTFWYAEQYRPSVRLPDKGAAPHGGPATPLKNPRVAEVAPSVVDTSGPRKAITTIAKLVSVAALLLTSCSKPQQTAIIGRWHEVGTTSVAAFHEDGTVELAADLPSGRTESSGKFSFITDRKLKIELSGKGPSVYQIEFSSGKMTLTDVDGEKMEFLRERQ